MARQDKIQPAEDNQIDRDTDSDWKRAFYIVSSLTIVISIIILIIGDPHKLSNPIDPDGNPCGQDDLENYPYIYFVTPSKQYLSRTVCVKECKIYNSQPQLSDKLDCYPNSVVKSCNFNIPKSNDRSEEVLLYDTAVYLGKVCMPKNIGYYKLIFEALHISSFDQLLSDLKSAFPFIAIFGFVAFLLSFATKILIDQENMVDQSIKVFFFLSTLGFILLGILFISRSLNIATASQPDDKNVIGDAKKLMQEVDSSNSSFLFNLIVSIVCFATSILYIKQYLTSDPKNNKERQKIVKLRNKMLEYISNIIENQNLIYLPIFAFGIFIVMSIFFFKVVLNVFSLGSTKSDVQGLPFEQFKTSGFAYLVMLFLFLGFFWIFIFIIQFCEYLVYCLTINEMKLLDEPDMVKDNNTRSLKHIYDVEVTKMISYRIGTIAKCSLLYFLLYFPRSFLESIDTSYQRKLTDQNGRRSQPDEVPHTFLMNIQRSISEKYESWITLKGLQPYGFFYCITREQGFSEAGKEMQTLIDQTAFWFEDMLDEGELFENQIKYSICFFISLFFCAAISFNSSLQISTIAIPIGFMFIVSYVISLLYVNMYGSIYSTFIIYYLVTDYGGRNLEENTSLPNNSQLKKFEDYINRIIQEEESEQQQGKNNLLI